MKRIIVLEKLKDQNTGELFDIATPWLEREVPTTIRAMVPLYENGVLLPGEQLAEYHLEVVGFTQEELDLETYSEYYRQNPALASRVRQYAALLAQYQLPPDAASDAITAAIMADDTKNEAQKNTDGAFLLALIHDVELNFNEVSGDGFGAWRAMPKLIQYLPEEPEVIA